MRSWATRTQWSSPLACLQTFVSSYSGHNKINRLLYLAEKRPLTQLELDALRMAHDEVKQASACGRAVSTHPGVPHAA